MAEKKATKKPVNVNHTKFGPEVDPVEERGLIMYSKAIAELLHRITPKEWVRKHPYNGLDYVEVGYVRRCLEDYCAKLRAMWSFETSECGDNPTLLKVKQLVIRGRLTIEFENGKSIVREQYGGSEVKCYKPDHKTKPNEPMDLGNDYKAAAADAFKKCCSSLGIAQDVYEPKVERTEQAIDRREELAAQRQQEEESGVMTVVVHEVMPKKDDILDQAIDKKFAKDITGTPVKDTSKELPKPKLGPGDLISEGMKKSAAIAWRNKKIPDGVMLDFIKGKFGKEQMLQLTVSEWDELMAYVSKQ